MSDPIQTTLPLFQHRYSARDGYILGVTALVRTIDGFIGFVCMPAASGNGMRTCPVMPAWIAGIQNTDAM